MTKDTKDKSHLTKGGPGDKYLGDGKVDKRYKGTKWEYNLFDVFPELKEYY